MLFYSSFLLKKFNKPERKKILPSLERSLRNKMDKWMVAILVEFQKGSVGPGLSWWMA